MAEVDQEKLRKLKKRRGTVKANVTRFQKVITTCETAGIFNQLAVRLPRFEKLLSEFEAVQEEIEDIEDTVYSEERTEFEDAYFTLLAKAQSLLGISQTNLPSCHETKPVIVPQVKLPHMSIPKFSGNYENWRSFKDIFDSMVHNNPAVSATEKLLYLSDALDGEAYEVIKFLNITADNYPVARTLLTERYDKKQFIVNAHIRALFDLPQVSRECPQDLRQLISVAKQHLRSIQALEMPIDQWDSIMIVLLRRKLDSTTCREWELCQKDPNTFPKLQDFYNFLEKRCFALEATTITPDNKHQTRKSFKMTAHVSTNSSMKQSTCKLCQGSHNLYQCEKFRELPIDQRIKAIQSTGACFNCLRIGHSVKNCTSSTCKKCNCKHHTLIHQDTISHNKGHEHAERSRAKGITATTTSNIASMTASNNQDILLATAQVLVKTQLGNWIPCRVLLDSASQSNFITKSFAEKLHTNFDKVRISINGISRAAAETKESITVTIKSRFEEINHTFVCLVLPCITMNLPTSRVCTNTWKLPDVSLADPSFAEPNDIDMLIGAELYFELFTSNQIKLGQGLPILQESIFGWIVAGPVRNSQAKHTVCHFSTQSLQNQLEQFWMIEEGERVQHMSDEERQAEELFKKTHYRDETGRFVVKLPLKKSPDLLGDSMPIAEKRFLQMQYKMSRDDHFSKQYMEFMTEYIELQHMTEVDQTNERNYIIPHHAVFKESSSTTKLRVVFDGSAKTSSGYSLNDLLLVGPKTQSDLFSILLRFRQHNYVICADIEKMYRQILIAPSDRNLQLILWKLHPEEDTKCFQLNTVTYGLASSPFLACRCLKQLADEHEAEFPDASTVIAQDFYVDDLLTGGKTIEEVKSLKQDIVTIMKRGQFNLRKWKSNSEYLLETPSDPGTSSLFINESPNSPTLGLFWNAHDDHITYNIQPERSGITKRQVLSQIAKLFDPLGLLAPLIMQAKLTMQELWKLKTDWDELLPITLQENWSTFRQELKDLNLLKISRRVLSTETENFELHAFSDASEQGYGAAIYARSILNDHINVQLFCAKSRIAPLRKISLPKLELCAAQLASRLTTSVLEALRFKPTKVYYWSDSTITLYWINTEPYKFKTFVANRVSEIQSLTNPKHWHHVTSQENPADLVSRGCRVQQLKDNDLWWNGPHFLYHKEAHWRLDQDTFNVNHEAELEHKHTIISCAATRDQYADELLDRFSSWSKLVRVIAYCFKFIEIAASKTEKKKMQTVPNIRLSTQDLNYATQRILKMVQQKAFPTELATLQENRQLHAKNYLLQLTPFLDSDGLLRVGGRIHHANIHSDQKHPILLPKRHHITDVIMRHTHHLHLHCGAEQLLAMVRHKYWVVSGRNVAKRITRSCVQCFKSNPIPAEHIMGNLPTARVQNSIRPFAVTGIDYAGPIQIRESRRRGRVHTSKAYVALFICMATKAIHLELVTSLSSESFMAALNRFISRRGLCSELFSDNGTNFVGANRVLTEMYDFVKNNASEISQQLSIRGITWSFIPPRAPHFGGIWEAAVRSFKKHFYKIARNLTLTFEECNTLIIQIEAVLNSRPITPVSADPHDLVALTPAHFLIGDTLLEPATYQYENLPENRLSRYQMLQKVRNQIWKRWSKEYLHQLQVRNRWKLQHPNVTEGALVIVIEDNLPPLQWCLGRVVSTHPGDDKVVRVASVLIKDGQIIKRPVKKLCILPIVDNGY